MGRLAMWVGVPVGLFLSWYDRLLSVDWLPWLLERGGLLIWWLVKGVFQLALALLALAGIGGAHLPASPFAGGPAFVTTDFARAFLGVLRDHGGEFGPEIWSYGGRDYWIAVRSTMDSTTFVDARDDPTQQVCRHLYAARAAKVDGQYLVPKPETIFGGMAWPNVVTLCRVDGGATTYEFPTLRQHGTLPNVGKAESPTKPRALAGNDPPADDINAVDRTIYGAQ
jgi:hypothetical protein